MAALMPQGKQQYFTAGGIPLVGGKVYTYAAGTTTPLATYTDAAAGTPNANPVILDSRGEASIFFSAVNYKIVVKDSLDSTIWTQDNLAGDVAGKLRTDLAASTGSANVGHIASGTGAVATTVQGKLRESVSVKDFGAVGDGVTDDTVAIKAAFSASNNVHFPYGTYLWDSVDSITKASQSGVHVTGDGATILLGVDQTASTYMFNFSACTDVSIAGLVINGDAYIGNAFYFANCTRVRFNGNTVKNLWRTSIVADGFALFGSACSDVEVSNNTFSRVNKSIVFDDGGSISSNVVIANNAISQGGHAAIITAHVNCSVTGNVIRYAALGPFASRTDMRNVAWAPSPVTADYGTGKGAAINSGSGVFASGQYPLNLSITNNTIEYVAEYAIGIESGDYVGATQLAGPAINTVISNNCINKTGVSAIFLTGMNGLVIAGNVIGTAGLSLAGDAAITLATRSGTTTSQVNNGIQNAVIEGNSIVDLTGVTQKAIYLDVANIEGALTAISIANNNVHLTSATKTWGVQIDNSGGTTTFLTGIRVIGNYFRAGSLSASATPFISGLRLYNSVYMGNPAINFGGPINFGNTFFQYSAGQGSNTARDPSYNQEISYSAMPTSGGWTQGAIVWNTTPSNAAGQPAGWIRVTTGSGNVLNTDWRAFGVTV